MCLFVYYLLYLAWKKEFVCCSQWQVVFSKESCQNIFHPTCSSAMWPYHCLIRSNVPVTGVEIYVLSLWIWVVCDCSKQQKIAEVMIYNFWGWVIKCHAGSMWFSRKAHSMDVPLSEHTCPAVRVQMEWPHVGIPMSSQYKHQTCKRRNLQILSVPSLLSHYQ